MKHQVYVTVREFLTNGGTLTDGRTIYTATITAKGSDKGCIFKPIGWFDAFEPVAPEHMTTVCRSNGTLPMNNILVYVEVPVTPIYK